MSSDPPSRSGLLRALKIALAIVLLPLGIVGLFVPVLQGILFLLIALALLSSEVPWMRRYQERIQERYPELWRKVEASKARAAAWLRGRSGGENGPSHTGRADR